MSGKMYSEKLAKTAFVFVFIGFNLTFLPQFVLGMEGMPRRYYDYPPQFESLHRLSTIGAFINAIGYTWALLNLGLTALFGKVKAPANPYNSLSLEWQTPSPPPHENFIETPVVTDYPYAYGKPLASSQH